MTTSFLKKMSPTQSAPVGAPQKEVMCPGKAPEGYRPFRVQTRAQQLSEAIWFSSRTFSMSRESLGGLYPLAQKLGESMLLSSNEQRLGILLNFPQLTGQNCGAQMSMC